MAWLRVDDGFTEHQKLVQLERGDRWTWMEVLTYCARQRNGGKVPEGIADVLKWVTPSFLETCENIGLLDRKRGTLYVHDWDLYNPKDPTNAARQARYRNRYGNVTRNGKSNDKTVTESNAPRAAARARPVPSPEEPRSLKRAGGSSTGAQASKDAAPAEPPRPDPSKLCDDCGATYGEGHYDTCPRLAKNQVETHR